MASTELRQRVRVRLQASTTGLLPALAEAPSDPVNVELGLQLIGDHVRCGLSTPPELRRWADELPLDAVSTVLEGLAMETLEWRIPEARLGLEELPDEGILAITLARRDVVGSLRTAVTGLSVRRRKPPGTLPAWTALADALRQFDEAVAETVPRRLAEELLGDRVALADSSEWIEALTDAASSDGDDAQFLAALAPDELGEPDETLLNEYFTSGRFHRTVEGYAAVAPKFRERLLQTLLVLEEAEELGNAFVPRRWLQLNRGETIARDGEVAVIRFTFKHETLAAASHDAGGEQVFELGALPGLKVDSDVTLKLREGEWTLSVYVVEGELSSVKLNGIDGAVEKGAWVARCTDAEGRVRIQVQDELGGQFDAHLAFDV